MHHASTQNTWSRSLFLLCGLTIFAQLSFAIAKYSANGMLGFLTGTEVTHSLLIPTIARALIAFICYEFLINSIFIGLLWYAVISLLELFDWQNKTARNFAITLWLIANSAVITANSYFLPNSIFANLPFSIRLTKIILIATSIFLIVVTGLVFFNGYQQLLQKKNRWRHSCILIFLIALLAIYAQYNIAEQTKVIPTNNTNKPNVIIIGIDAMRPDFTSFNHNPLVQTPNIDHFLQSATVLTAAHTPLARTFPSWVSILTGMYPKHNHVRENLDMTPMQLSETTIAERLQHNGYETLYASDDNAWSIIDKHFGFDHNVTPPTGMTALLIGFINDFPLSNLLITTPLGPWLFPYNYGNHLITTTYQPDNFLHAVQVQLKHRTGQPLFFAIHFNLSGWPYFWIHQKNTLETSDFTAYKNSRTAVDQQLGEFFKILTKNNLLQHSLVILLSDHGTSLGLPGDQVTAENLYQGNKNNIKLLRGEYSIPVMNQQGQLVKWSIDTSHGYGGSVLSLVAYHPLLAFKGYGLNIGQRKTIVGHTSLIDVAPTILDFLNMPPLEKADGISLKPYFLNAQEHINVERPLFMESAFSITEIEKKHISIPAAIKKASSQFQVNDHTGLITMKRISSEVAHKQSQKAILQGEWLLANLPPTLRYKQIGIAKFVSYLTPPQYVLVNLKTGKWTTEMQSPLAHSAPLPTLLNELHNFYGDELTS